MRLGRAEHVETVAVGHAEVRHDDFEGRVGENLDRLAHIAGFADPIPALLQQEGHGGARGRLVLDEEDRRSSAHASGRRIVKHVPRPGVDSTSICPL